MSTFNVYYAIANALCLLYSWRKNNV